MKIRAETCDHCMHCFLVHQRILSAMHLGKYPVADLITNPHRQEDAQKLLRKRCVGLRNSPCSLVYQINIPFINSVEDFLLRLKIMIEGTFSDPYFIDDVVDCCNRKTLRREKSVSYIQ